MIDKKAHYCVGRKQKTKKRDGLVRFCQSKIEGVKCYFGTIK